MKWVVDRIGKEQTWYSADVIERIKYLCNDINGLGVRTLAKMILELIEDEDKE